MAEVKANIHTENDLDEMAEKSSRLVENLKEAQQITDSLSGEAVTKTEFDVNIDVDADMEMLMKQELLSKVLARIKEETRGIPHVNVYFHIT